jgi:flavorubredoxin
MDITDIPFRMLPAQRVAADTHVIRQVFGEGLMPQVLQLNSVVITGAEPVIVDTGAGFTVDAWSEAAFSLVDPADVRWVYLSHDDTDHTGGLPLVLERCPQATVVTTAFMAERLMAEIGIPMERMRWVNHGESWDAGDRRLTAFIPPVFDSPTTRGLFDSTSGAYWASDAFGAANPVVVDDVRELDGEAFRQAFLDFQRHVSPWHRWLDATKYAAHLDALAALRPSVVTSCHGIALRGGALDGAFALLRRLPTEEPFAQPGNDELALLQQLLAPAVAA